MPLAEPPADLSEFPAWELEAGGEICRIHRAARDPWWFDDSPHGRFNLTRRRGFGTCYFADEPLGAFVETYRDLGILDEVLIESRRLYTTRFAHPLRLADCTSREARGFGITAEIGSSERYELTQAWANRLYETGFRGIRYLIRHDPAQGLVGVALFGSQAPQDATGDDQPIPESILEKAQREFGFAIWPASAL